MPEVVLKTNYKSSKESAIVKQARRRRGLFRQRHNGRTFALWCESNQVDVRDLKATLSSTSIGTRGKTHKIISESIRRLEENYYLDPSRWEKPDKIAMIRVMEQTRTLFDKWVLQYDGDHQASCVKYRSLCDKKYLPFLGGDFNYDMLRETAVNTLAQLSLIPGNESCSANQVLLARAGMITSHPVVLQYKLNIMEFHSLGHLLSIVTKSVPIEKLAEAHLLKRRKQNSDLLSRFRNRYAREKMLDWTSTSKGAEGSPEPINIPSIILTGLTTQWFGPLGDAIFNNRYLTAGAHG
ncbi:MAG TPA: hypothetical protein EYO58_07560, partial [Flavobacteriales bacterium]|nr:hypothetical protein [Flavobacteriales bacterium]